MMEIKKTLDGRPVTVKDGSVWVGSTFMGHRFGKVSDMSESAKAAVYEKLPDAHYHVDKLVLTKTEGKKAMAACNAWMDERIDDLLSGREKVIYRMKLGVSLIETQVGYFYGDILNAAMRKWVADRYPLVPIWDIDYHDLAIGLYGADKVAALPGGEASPETYRSQGGKYLPEYSLVPITSLLDRLADKYSRINATEAEYAAKRQAKETEIADLENSFSEIKVLEKSTRAGGEGCPDPYARLLITDKDGESKEFFCRNIFDFGYIIGWAGKGEGPMTDFEARAQRYLVLFPPIVSHIRM